MSMRFAWSRATTEEKVKQLKLHGFGRILSTDSLLRCVVCRQKPKHTDHVLYPSKGCGTSNQIIAHQDCVDTAYAAEQAKHRSEAVELGIAPILVPTHAKASGADPLNQLDKIRQEIWTDGYNAGLKAALAKLQGLSDAPTQPKHY